MIQVLTKIPVEGDSKAWYDNLLEGIDAEVTLTQIRFKTPEHPVMVTLGEETTKLYVSLDKYENFKDVVGYVFHTKKGIVIPSFHPKDMYRYKGAKFFIERALEKASKVAHGYKPKPEKLLISNNPQEVLRYLDECLKSQEVCIDLETRGERNSIPNKVSAVGISKGPDEALCFDDTLPLFSTALRKLSKIVSDPNIRIIGQNFINFDGPVLKELHDMNTHGQMWDTLDCFKLLHPYLDGGLHIQGAAYLHCEPWKDESWKAEGRILREYCAKDVIRTYRIQRAQNRELQLQGNYDYYRKVLLPLGSTVTRAIVKGVNFDHEERERQKKLTEPKIEELKQDLVELARPYLMPKEVKKKKRDKVNDILQEFDGYVVPEDFQKMKKDELQCHISQYTTDKECYLAKKQDAKYNLKPGHIYKKAYKVELSHEDREYNPGSSQQTLQVLHNMKVKVPNKRGSDGVWKPAAGKLQRREIILKQGDRPEVFNLIKKLDAYAPMVKFYNAYLNAKFQEDGRWRSQFRLRGAETGRATSRMYFGRYCGNIQNQPSRGDSKDFKRCFVPDPGYVFFDFDQSAAESRIVAYLSKCPRMIEILEKGIDFHAETARLMFNLQISDRELEGTVEREVLAKTLNHSNSYGVGPFVMSGLLISNPKAKRMFSKQEVMELQERWYKAYPEVRSVFQKETIEFLKEHGYLENPLGRRRYFNEKIEEKMYKEAYADIPQSTIPDISNLMWQWVSETYAEDEAQVLIQCHDSLAGQVREDIAESFKRRFLEAGRKIVLEIKGQKFHIPWDGGLRETYYG